MVFLPNAAPWLETWLYEMTAFPNGEYNDQVDSYTQIVCYFVEAVNYARLARSREHYKGHKRKLRVKTTTSNAPIHGAGVDLSAKQATHRFSASSS